MRDEKGRFVKNHPKIGGMVKGSKHSVESKALISKSLIGTKRAYKGEEAGYHAKHIDLIKKHGNATKCQNSLCSFKNPKRYEWANISKEYKRTVEDYVQLCPSCHRKYDLNLGGVDIDKNL